MPAYSGPDPVDPETLRIAWSEDLDGLFPVDQAVRDVLRRARTAIDGIGGSVTDAAPPMHGIRDSIIPLRDVRTLILHAGRLERIHQMGNELLVASIERAKRTTALDVAKAEIARSRVATACATFFDDFDILAMPATQMVSFRADQAAPTEIEGRKIPEALDTCLSTYAITMLGWPCMSIPCGFADDGQPVGLQLVAPHGKEARLVAFAFFLEKSLGWTNHIPPIARESKQ